MIKLKRTTKPAVLVVNEKAWAESYVAARNLKDQAAIDLAEKKYRHKEIKESLREMHHRKCAFCESFIEHVSYSHIEHFRPKKIYPKQLVRWSNLFLACGVCNGASHKGDKFPLAAEGGPLVNPCTEDPSFFLTYNFDPVTNAALVGYKDLRGKKTIDTLGLNRPDLANDIRSQVVKKLYTLRKIFDMPDTTEDARELILDALTEAAKDNQHYSAFAKSMLP